MALILLAYLAGVLTIVSPCILPVLPFVFARTDRPFREAGLFVLIGMAVTFAMIATLAAVAGGWAVAANHYGRLAALILMGLFGVTLLVPQLADRLTRPVVALGNRLSAAASGPQTGSSLVLGVATGFLWAPCAGPVLGLILTGAALQGASIQTSFLLLSYALGAATSLGLALIVGGRVFTAMKKSLGAGEWVKRVLCAAVIIAVIAVALGVDTGFLTRISSGNTISLEQSLLDRFLNRKTAEPAAALAAESKMPSLDGAVEWINSPPLTPQDLKGKVVLIDFWTYSCVNCLRALPYVEAWAEKYRDQGLVVIGVHAPEFAFEKQLENVRKAVADLKVTYPVAVDNNFTIWRAFNNQYWPAHYFIDAQGNIRHHHFGEGAHDESERVIQKLLAEANNAPVKADLVAVSGAGTQAAADFAALFATRRTPM
jgi:cytochrome c biogenesis protein CcdA/thiol-disulfide isomerase/thioredoxin